MNLLVYDSDVNMGPTEATKILQVALGLTNDGVWGPQTAARAAALGSGNLVPAIELFTNYRVQVSWTSAVIAILVSCGVGIAFGTVPAVRAARMDPVESLKYE